MTTKKRTWSDVFNLVGDEDERPIKTSWGYRCPKCNEIVIPDARLIKGTHNLLEYWACKCDWIWAHIRMARATYGEYASPIYKPGEEAKIPNLLSEWWRRM